MPAASQFEQILFIFSALLPSISHHKRFFEIKTGHKAYISLFAQRALLSQRAKSRISDCKHTLLLAARITCPVKSFPFDLCQIFVLSCPFTKIRRIVLHFGHIYFLPKHLKIIAGVEEDCPVVVQSKRRYKTLTESLPTLEFNKHITLTLGNSIKIGNQN